MLSSTSEGLYKLADKLQNANRTIVVQKKRQKQQIQDRLENMETRILVRKKLESDAVQKIRHNSEQLSVLSSQSIKNFGIKALKEEQIIRTLKDQMENDLEFEEREHEIRIDQIIQKQTQSMSLSVDSLTKKSKQISEKHLKLINGLNKSISNLQREVHEEVEARQENCKRIKDDVIVQINKLSKMLEKEEERKANSTRKLYEMMDEISGKLETQIEEQSSKRKKNNEAVLRLLQCACQKLQQKIRA